MKVSEYLVDFLIKKGVTDVFGMPGGVVLDLIYALDDRKEINAHLSYHEQGAAFEACGYAQVNHQMGMTYATRGPGFTNLITGIADAYADSIPVLFITAHTGSVVGHTMRFEKDQELDTVSIVRHITNYAKAVESVDEVCCAIQTAYKSAMFGRKGPVFLDFSANLWNKELPEIIADVPLISNNSITVAGAVKDALEQAQRPVFMVGDGVRQANAVELFEALSTTCGIPVLSSRCAQDVGAVSRNYFGYIGSHGIRHCNYIFAKSDCVIAIGNRLYFPIESRSYSKVLNNKRVIRIDVDSAEFVRKIPNSVEYTCDALNALKQLQGISFDKLKYKDWLKVCNTLKKVLYEYDRNEVIELLTALFNKIEPQQLICSDVGNNEFWVSRAYVDAGIRNRILYSKSFGAMGCAIPKAIGAYYASESLVLCLVGDQGFQINVQELQLIANGQLPIHIVILNNRSSGMIRSRQKLKYNAHYIHTTNESGYGNPNFAQIALAYNIEYMDFNSYMKLCSTKSLPKKPIIIELILSDTIDLAPSLPIGNDLQNMSPLLPSNLYKKLEKI